MKKIIKENKAFLVIYVVLLIIGGCILILSTKKDIHLFINAYHSTFFDYFFRYITYLGDGITPVVLTLAFLFITFRKSVEIAASGILAGLFAQMFKRLVFPDVIRPKPFFNGIAELYFVPGVHMHTTLSLPSGHTASAFALFFVLSTFAKNKIVKILCLLMALLIGYSRMYLSQHFLIDVYLGSMIGVVAGVIITGFMKSAKGRWLDLSLVKLTKRNG